MASGIDDLGAPGLLYSLLTGLPVRFSTAVLSKNSRAAGVAITCTVHPRSCASVMNKPIAVAGPRGATHTHKNPTPGFTVTGGTPIPREHRRQMVVAVGEVRARQKAHRCPT